MNSARLIACRLAGLPETPAPIPSPASGQAGGGSSLAPVSRPYTKHPDPVMEQWVRDNEVTR